MARFQHIRNESYTPNITEDYFHLPKLIGSVPAEQLVTIAKASARKADLLDDRPITVFHSVAGSAYIEASLVGANPDHDYDDLYLSYLDNAEYHLRNVAAKKYEELENGIRPADDHEKWLRAELQCDFMNVYRDIVCGEITDLTQKEVISSLNRHLRQANPLTAKYETMRGFAAETNVILETWQEYRPYFKNPIVIPSTERGGSGSHRPRETHDLVFVQQNDDGWEYTQSEVKGGKGLTAEALARYGSMVIHYANGNTTVYPASHLQTDNPA